MTTRYQKNLDIMAGWLANHPEHKDFVSILQDAGKAFTDALVAEVFGGNTDAVKETTLEIAVGKAADKAFYPYLTSNLTNPRIVIGSNNGIPEIVIHKTHTIDLGKVERVKVQTESIKEGDYSFERFNIVYRLNDLDYMVHVVISTK